MAVGGISGARVSRKNLLRALLAALEEELPAALDLRRRLHANPELGGEERVTAGLVRDALPVGGEPFADTGVLASIGNPDRDAVWVRAELDGLGIAEQTGVPFAARNGHMHACGHDVHLAALVALIRAAHRMHDDLPVRLVGVFQPSEERHPSGALALVNDSTLTDGIRAAVAAHVHPDLCWGSIGAEPGAVNAAADAVHIVISGEGGHAAYPHRAADPILALAHLVVGLHGLVGRRVDPVHAATLTVGSVHAGSTENVIPSSAEARVTFRALEQDDHDNLRTAVTDMVQHVVKAHGCSATMSLTKSEPPLVNDENMAAAVRAAAAEVGFTVAQPWRSCGGDDFAHYSAVCPAIMIFVGLQGAPGFRQVPLHQPGFLPPEESVPAVAKALALGYFAAAATLAG